MRLYNDFIINKIYDNGNLNMNIVYDYICCVLILY